MPPVAADPDPLLHTDSTIGPEEQVGDSYPPVVSHAVGRAPGADCEDN